MSEEIWVETVRNFLKRVIEIEEKPEHLSGKQETARREEIKRILNNFCKEG